MRVLSHPTQNDGLIRYWLARNGWRVGHVKDGVVWVPTVDHANYLTSMFAVGWIELAPQPKVGVYSDRVEEE